MPETYDPQVREVIEKIIFRRGIEKKLDGYTMITSIELAEALYGLCCVQPSRPVEAATPADQLWDCSVSVLGLPCICDTPELHSAECVNLRAIANSVEVWRQRVERQKAVPAPPADTPTKPLSIHCCEFHALGGDNRQVCGPDAMPWRMPPADTAPTIDQREVQPALDRARATMLRLASHVHCYPESSPNCAFLNEIDDARTLIYLHGRLQELVQPPADPAPTQNSEALASFVAFCQANPNYRFWQALRNWSIFDSIIGENRGRGNTSPYRYETRSIDTFHLAGLDGMGNLKRMDIAVAQPPADTREPSQKDRPEVWRENGKRPGKRGAVSDGQLISPPNDARATAGTGLVTSEQGKNSETIQCRPSSRQADADTPTLPVDTREPAEPRCTLCGGRAEYHADEEVWRHAGHPSKDTEQILCGQYGYPINVTGRPAEPVRE